MKYRMKTDSKLESKAVAGTIVYPLNGYDYGSASDDNRAFGVEHKSVTLNPDGDYPYFTVPISELEIA